MEHPTKVEEIDISCFEVDFQREFKSLTLPPEYRAVVNLLDKNDYDTLRYGSAALRKALLVDWQNLPTQIRPRLIVNQQLLVAAQLRACVAALSGEIGYGYGGICPRDIVEQLGIYLPLKFYPKQGNNLETLIMTNRYLEPDTVVNLLSSPQCPVEGSIVHMNGLDLHATQVLVGVGFFRTPHSYVWCFHSVHPDHIWEKLDDA